MNEEIRFSLGMIPQEAMIQEPEFSPRALKDNEWTHIPEVQEFILRDRQAVLDAPDIVHNRLIVGPSAIGKSTIAAHWARFNENDAVFRKQLRLRTGHTKKVLGVHISFSQALLQATEREAGISKNEATQSHREVASERIIDAIEALDTAFAGDPDYTVISYVDTVGVTESDLGTSAVSRFAKDPYTHFVAVMPNQTVEENGLDARDYIIAHKEDESLDTWLQQQKGIVAGTLFQGNAQELVESCGTRDAWLRHWGDIYQQLGREGYFADNPYLTFEQFLQSPGRFSLYEEWIPKRLAELGVDTQDPTRFALVPNIYNASGIHTHFDRMYEKKSRKQTHHFPMQLLGPGKDPSTLQASDILSAMRVKD